MKKIFSFLAFLLISLSFFAQEEKTTQKTRILFIFDASQSMFGRFGDQSKIDVAQKLFSEALDSLKQVENLELALRVYGNRSNINLSAQNCEDTHLEVPFGENNVEDIKHVIKGVVPKGTTPIAKSLEASESDFPPCSDCRNVIVLITDGIEACDGDPCAIARALRKNDVFLKPFVIGVGMIEDYKEHFYCIGNYYDAKDKEQFKTVLGLVLSEALNNTSCEVDLLDVNGRPTETNVNMSFYDQHSGELRYNFVHTMNRYGRPDTLIVDPSISYKIVVHTKPSVEIENVRLKPAQHNIISIESPQGGIKITSPGDKFGFEHQSIVQMVGDGELIYHQSFDENIKYLVGKYKVTVLTVPRYFTEVNVMQDKVSEVEVPIQGKALFSYPRKGFVSIYELNSSPEKLIYSVEAENQLTDLKMLPGDYRVVFRSDIADRAFQTVEKEFTIKSGKSTRITL